MSYACCVAFLYSLMLYFQPTACLNVSFTRTYAKIAYKMHAVLRTAQKTIQQCQRMVTVTAYKKQLTGYSNGYRTLRPQNPQNTSASRHSGAFRHRSQDTSTRVPWSRKGRDTSTQDNSDETQLHRWFCLNFGTNFVVPKCLMAEVSGSHSNVVTRCNSAVTNNARPFTVHFSVYKLKLRLPKLVVYAKTEQETRKAVGDRNLR